MNKPCKQARKIIVNDQEYWWAFIKSKILIYKDNVKKVIDLSDFTGLSWDELERGQWKRWLKITPGYVADWIKEHGLE